VGEGHQEHHRGPGHGLLQQREHLLGLEILERESNAHKDGAIISGVFARGSATKDRPSPPHINSRFIIHYTMK